MKPPFGGMLNDWGAAVSTANATWWMLLVTLLSAGAALLVVWSAFQVQRLQFLEERRKEEDRKTALNNDAITAVMETSIFVKALQEKFAFERVEREVWNDISRCNEHRLVLQHFLTSDLTLLSNRYWLSAVHQRLFEAERGLNLLLPENQTTHGAERRKGLIVLGDAADRTRQRLEQYGEIKTEVGG